jgi:hypothetical protein
MLKNVKTVYSSIVTWLRTGRTGRRRNDMALPQEVDAEKVRAVKEAIAKMTSQEIAALPSLESDDIRLFGAISQLYCFLDLNLRRALEVMHMAKRLPPESVSRYPDYRDAALAAILRGSVGKMDPKVENLGETLFHLEEIERCRTYRNLISHFAGKRYPDADVYVLASKSDKDARMVLGESLPSHGVHFSIAGRSEFFQLEGLLNGHSAWLVKKVIEWNERYPAVAEKTGA